MLSVRAACRTNRGLVREKNEDDLLFIDKRTRAETDEAMSGSSPVRGAVFFGVFDGMGGLRDGDLASRVAAEELRCIASRSFFGKKVDEDFVRSALLQLNDRVCRLTTERQRTAGSTAVVLVLQGRRFTVGNVGDSPAFLLRNGVLARIYEEHTDRVLLERLGAKKSPSLTQHLGIPESKMALEPYAMSGELHPGDRFLLASDGLSSFVPEEGIAAMCGGIPDPDALAEALVGAALDAGGGDNVTVLVCDIH